MHVKVEGLHHFTAISGDPTENAKFYVNVLGLRMVKKTVNHDAPHLYHLFYGDREGTPGSSITFFPLMADSPGKPGAGLVTELGLRMPEDSLNYWKDRLEENDVDFEEQEWREKKSLRFEDDSGMSLRLVPGESDDFRTWEDNGIPEEYQLRGMHHVQLSVNDAASIDSTLEFMGLEEKEGFGNRYFEAEDGSGVEVRETSEQGRMGRGSVHHVAFKAGDEEDLEKLRTQLQEIGLRPSPVISRKYFSSVYARTPAGILFEFSTMGPGYTADETVEELGGSLVLPEKLEDRRDEILEALPELNEEEIT